MKKVKPHTLSKRETQVLELLSKGYLNRDMAAELGINERTVATYYRRLKKKLGIDNNMNVFFVVIAAIKRGILTYDFK